MLGTGAIDDVLVIGGGPAGSTVAALLAERGRRVTVLEKAKFPRDHVGESLLPYCYKVFERLGVLDEMAARFVRKPGVRFIDATGDFKTTWCFRHVIKDASYMSFHVPRGEFDQLLLKNAERKGARVLEETAVTHVSIDSGTTCVRARGPAGETEHRARFVVDASGRDTLMASRFAWKKAHEDLDRTALSTHWLGAKFVEGLRQGLLHIIYLGGDKKGWIWVIPISPDRISIGVVLNHSYIREQKAKLTAEGKKDWAMALYRQELAYSPFVNEVLGPPDVRTALPLMVNGDYSYFVEKKFGPNFAIVGDAGTFIDPIFASGVYMAMNSSWLAADAIHAGLEREHTDCVPELTPAYKQIEGAYRLVGRAIAMFYNANAINFAEAASAAGILHEKYADALSLAHSLIAGDFFAKHRRYEKVLDLLQNPRMYAMFREIVGKSEDLATTCNVSYDEVFRAFLDKAVGEG